MKDWRIWLVLSLPVKIAMGAFDGFGDWVYQMALAFPSVRKVLDRL